MKRSAIHLATLLLAISIAANPVWGQGRGRGKPSRNATSTSQVDATISVVFTTEERGMITDWFRTNSSGLPPGLANRETLPPGLERQLRRNGTLPPGLQKKLHPLPYALERRLSRLPAGYGRVVIGGSVILMNRTTGLIYDLVRDVISDNPTEAQTRPSSAPMASQPSSSGTSTRVPVATAGDTRNAPSGMLAGTPSQGAELKVRTTTTLSTKSHQTGDLFIATLEAPWIEGSRVIAPKGAEVEGRIVEADEGGRVKGVARLAMELNRLQTVSGRWAEITTNTLAVEAHGTKSEDAAKIGITSGIGAVVGAVVGGGKGAAIGAATGAAAGTGVVLVTRGEAATISSETVLLFTLQPSR